MDFAATDGDGRIDMKRYTYFDGGKWRMRVGDAEYSGRETDRLSAYEDTGLEPEDMKRAFNEDAVLKLAGQALGMSPDRLRKLAQAEKEGRLVVLPCEIGSPVYSHARKLDGADYVRETEFWWSDIPQMSKTVFLTREAAEAALKEREAEHESNV